MGFKLGDWVDWDSHQPGAVVAVIPPNGSITRAFEALPFKRHARLVVNRYAKKRPEESYLVATQPGPQTKRVSVYWPEVDRMKQIESRGNIEL